MGFQSYFYVATPRGFTSDDLEPFREYINSLTEPGMLRLVEVVQKRSLWGYRGDNKPLFLKLVVGDPKSVPKVRGLFERGEVSFRDLFSMEGVTTYESNIPYILRFMIDTQGGPEPLVSRYILT